MSTPLNRWDAEPDRTPYCCSFHWFRLPDGRIVGLDVIRSNDTDQISLRAYLVEEDGAVRGLAYAAPTAAWETFATGIPPDLDGTKPVLGRGTNWVAGALHTSGQQINSVRFHLTIAPQSRALSSSELWDLDFVHLAASDFTTVHTTGWVEIDEVRYPINSLGPVSIHLGAHLPSYGYCATVHDPTEPSAPRILLASVAGDDIRVFGKLLENVAFTYAYGDEGVPSRMYDIGRFELDRIPMGVFGCIELTDIQPFAHRMLGVEAVTATACATLRRAMLPDVPLGRVILDYRGSMFTECLSRR
jgi:hypothetical protein